MRGSCASRSDPEGIVTVVAKSDTDAGADLDSIAS
jgi:hypothetical protein